MIVCLLILLCLLFFPVSAQAATYTASNDQELTNNVRALKPGDVLQLKAGTYHTQLYLSSTTNGTAEQPITIAAEQGATVIFDGSTTTAPCVRLQGSHIKVSDITVTDCYSHGVLIQGKYITFENSTVANSVKENEAIPHVKWGSGLKVALGAENITLRNNTVYHNWGEGIAITRGRNVRVENNHIYDNFSVNLYIDNSSQISANDNFITCKPNSGYERDGRRANGLSISEEQYDGWGSQLRDLKLTNNIIAYCHRGISFYSAEVATAGLRSSTIDNNILWDSQDYNLYINTFPETSDTTISNNIVHHSSGKMVKIPSTQGLTFATNTWLGGVPPTTVTSGTDQYITPVWLSQPTYSKESFQQPVAAVEPSPAPSPSPVSSPSPSPSPIPTPSPVVSPSPNPSPSPTPINPKPRKKILISWPFKITVVYLD